jgi:hypothetical protein
MAKPRKQRDAALQQYLAEITKLYPQALIRVLPDSLTEPEPWVEVYLPSRSVIPAAGKFAQLENEIDEKFGVSIVTLTMPRNGEAAA